MVAMSKKQLNQLTQKITSLEKELLILRNRRNSSIMEDFVTSGLMKNESAFSRNYADKYRMKPNTIIHIVREQLRKTDDLLLVHCVMKARGRPILDRD